MDKFIKGEMQLSPAVQKFYEVITSNPVLWMHFEEMITQVCNPKQTIY